MNNQGLLTWTVAELNVFAMTAMNIFEMAIVPPTTLPAPVDHTNSKIYIMLESVDNFNLIRQLALSTDAQELVSATPPMTSLYTFIQIQCECATPNTFFECFSNSLCLVSNFNTFADCSTSVTGIVA